MGDNRQHWLCPLSIASRVWFWQPLIHSLSRILKTGFHWLRCAAYFVVCQSMVQFVETEICAAMCSVVQHCARTNMSHLLSVYQKKVMSACIWLEQKLTDSLRVQSRSKLFIIFWRRIFRKKGQSSPKTSSLDDTINRK